MGLCGGEVWGLDLHGGLLSTSQGLRSLAQKSAGILRQHPCLCVEPEARLTSARGTRGHSWPGLFEDPSVVGNFKKWAGCSVLKRIYDV
jgi:hypothetical protein